jgi:hypothetical protein
LVILPTSLPDMNPLEQAFGKSTQTLRRDEARSRESVMAAASDDPRTISTAADARACFAGASFPVR